jgi:hypothetical protein
MRYTTEVKEAREVQPAFIERAAVHAYTNRNSQRIVELGGIAR